MLFGYFDESGTDNSNGQVVVAGFIGTSSEWASVMTDFNAEVERVQVKPFHRVHCQHRNKAYERWSSTQSAKHIARLSDIVSSSSLFPISASFIGNWNNIGLPPSFYGRFPHPYHVCFELLVQNIVKYANAAGESVCLVLETQDQFSLRAHKIYNIHKFNGKWGEIITFNYADKQVCSHLQCADLFAWEIRRYYWAAENNKKRESDFPLIRRIVARMDYREGDLGNFLNEEGVRRVVHNRLPDLRWPPGFSWG